MADLMQRQGQPNDNSLARNRSVANPTDAAMMVQKGDIRQGMTVRDLIENVLKVPLDAPAQALIQAVKRQGQNATMGGKAQSMMGPPRGQAPSRPPMGRPQGGQDSGGLAELLGV